VLAFSLRRLTATHVFPLLLMCTLQDYHFPCLGFRDPLLTLVHREARRDVRRGAVSWSLKALLPLGVSLDYVMTPLVTRDLVRREVPCHLGFRDPLVTLSLMVPSPLFSMFSRLWCFVRYR
jgi:hypothetical protein